MAAVSVALRAAPFPLSGDTIGANLPAHAGAVFARRTRCGRCSRNALQ